MTGFCIGGSLATIAACWAALQSPTSDVRCVTFGAPNVGNAAFVDAFRRAALGCLDKEREKDLLHSGFHVVQLLSLR